MNKLYTNFIITVDERNPEGGTYAVEGSQKQKDAMLLLMDIT